MKSIINLQNNYYLEEVEDTNTILKQAKNIEDINIMNLFKSEHILIKIDFNVINENKYKKILKKLLFLIQVSSKIKKDIGIKIDSKILLGYIVNYNHNDKKQKEMVQALNAVLYTKKYERYNYIYDTVCEYLDSFFYGKNLCDFKNNKCGEKRNTSSLTGCCHHYKNKWLGPLSKFVLCEHLNDDYTCGAKCISCKLFTCDYLEKKGIKFRINDILLLDAFFNPLQKYFIKYMVFTPKEKILKRLVKL